MKKVLCTLIASLALLSCQERFDGDHESLLVVEGWIEDGGFPVVMVTMSVPVNTEHQYVGDLSSYIVRYARVVVYEGEDSIVLTGKYNNAYFPPYIYTTSRIRGKAGNRYRLKVEYDRYLATAATTVPRSPQADSMVVSRSGANDSLFVITAYFHDIPDEKNYYQFFTRVGADDRQFLASYLGSIDDAVLGDGSVAVPVYRGKKATLPSETYTPFFREGDTVAVKFANVDEYSYEFWKEYSKILSISKNMFLGTFRSLPSNIQGGLGFWGGYGSDTHYFVIPHNVTR